MNRAVAWVLRSPVAGVADSALTLLSIHGRRSGREMSLPVQYAAGDDAIWLFPGRPETKTWWRNLEGGAPVRLRLRGRDVEAKARVVHGDQELAETEKGLAAYAGRFPRTARQSLDVPERAVLVRLDVPDDILGTTRVATCVAGTGPVAWIRRHPLGAFFFITFAISWGYWIPAVVAGGHVSHFPGLLGPMLAALVLTPVLLGSGGLRDLLARMGRWRVSLRWYAAAATPFAVAILTFVLLGVMGQAPSWSSMTSVGGLPAIGWIGTFILMTLIDGYGEETGWRGFAWPRLRERHTLGGAALILAVPWAVWHIPTFFLDSGMRGFTIFMFLVFFIGLTAGAVVLGWLYEHARSSILIVALWHSCLNMGSAPKGTQGAIAAAVMTFVMFWAVDILRRERSAEAAERPTAEAGALAELSPH